MSLFSSRVAATRSPVIFIGTGEHIPDFEVFDVKPFVSRLLGMGDLSGLMDKIQNVMPADELLPKLTEGAFTLRLLYEMFQNLQNMGPLGQVSYPIIDLILNKFVFFVLL